MKKYNFNYQSSYNNVIINAVKWIPETQPKGIIQIAHGVTEYIERYESFANYMTNLGYIVVGNDALGHGRSLIDEKKLSVSFDSKNYRSYISLIIEVTFEDETKVYSNFVCVNIYELAKKETNNNFAKEILEFYIIEVLSYKF